MSVAPPVLLDELVDALDDDPSWTRFHYLDRQTGAIETALTEEADGSGSFVDVRADTARFVPIEPLGESLRVELRQRFIERHVEEPTQRLDLKAALDGPRGLAAFARQLRSRPALFDAFRAFRLEALAPAARSWMAAQRVRADLRRPSK